MKKRMGRQNDTSHLVCEVLRSWGSLNRNTSQTSPNFTYRLRSQNPRGYKEKHYTSLLHTYSYTPLYICHHLPSSGRTWKKNQGVKDRREVVKFGQKGLVITGIHKFTINLISHSQGHKLAGVRGMTTRYCTVSGLKTWHIHRLFGGIANSVLTALRLEDRVTSSMIHPPAALRDSYQGQNDTSVTGLGLAQPMTHKPNESIVKRETDPGCIESRGSLPLSNFSRDFQNLA